VALSGVRLSMMVTGTARVTFLARLRPGVWLVTEDPRDPAAAESLMKGLAPRRGTHQCRSNSQNFLGSGGSQWCRRRD